jgi:hypothetical protein
MIRLLESYFDDSSDEKRERFYACGGLLGSSAQRDVFDMAWSNETSVLAEPFRSSDCEGGHGQFKNWTKPQRDELMRNLVTIIHATELRGYVSVVPVADYRKVFPNCGEHAPLFLAVRQCVMNMAFMAEAISTETKICFESGPGEAETLRIFNSIKAFNAWTPTRRLRGIAFDGKHLRPLQAADLIAREGYKHIENLGVRPTRKPVKTLTGKIYVVLWGQDSLRFLADNGGPEHLALLAEWDKRKDAPRFVKGVMPGKAVPGSKNEAEGVN